MKPDPKNLAAFAMALCHQIGVDAANTRTMKGVYLMVKRAEEARREAPEINRVNDMTDPRWAVFVGMLATEMSFPTEGRPTTEHHMNMVQRFQAAMKEFEEHPDLAHQMARVILEDLYPCES